MNGVQTFDQHNWVDCNPNPDACQPQNGTWYYDRAGWCPGAIAKWFDYNITPYVSGGSVELKYKFYDNYVDQCHPNNPNCVTGVTCSNCSDGFNPTLDVACNLVVFAQNPVLTGIRNFRSPSPGYSVRPNPASGFVEVYAFGDPAGKSFPIQLLTLAGVKVDEFPWNGKQVRLDLSHHPAGIYFLKIMTEAGSEMKKVILQ